MNKLYIRKEIELPKGSFLYIGEEVPEHPKAKIFDPTKSDSFNPLRCITKKTARELARSLYTAEPGGTNTLTVRNGRRALARALFNAKRFDDVRVESRIKGVKEEVEEMIDELLFTDVMRSALCSDNDFAFTGKNRKVFARINRAELGDDDALVFGLLLMSYYKEQIIVDDLGFYGRESHVSLIRQGRLIGRVNFLDELPEKLRNEALLIEDKAASGTTYEDAVTLARYAGLRPDPLRQDSPYNRFVTDAMD